MIKKNIEGFDNIEEMEKFEELLEEKNEMIYLIWKVGSVATIKLDFKNPMN